MPLPFSYRLWFHLLSWLAGAGKASRSRYVVSDQPHAGVALPAGDYLAWMRGNAVTGMGLTDRVHPLHRLAWLRQPGLNLLWLRLENDWIKPQLENLGRVDGSGDLHLRRVPRWLGKVLEVVRPFQAFERSLKQTGVGQWRAFWPPPDASGSSAWHDWALFLSELSMLRLEDVTPEVDASPPAKPLPANTLAKIGAHAHLHFLAAWPEMAVSLAQLPTTAKLFVTMTENAVAAPGISVAQVTAEIARDFPGAVVRRVPNRGRDMAPFLALLAEGAFDGLDCVCKLHGKMSFRDGRLTWLGVAWRRQSLFELLPSPAGVADIANRFLADPLLGVVGNERLRLPNERIWKVFSGEADGGLLLNLMRTRLGTDLSREIEFFAGSMFWFRPQAFAALRLPPPGGWPFPDEPLPDTGTLAHALERLLPTAAKHAGFRLAGLPPLSRYPETKPPNQPGGWSEA
jgi:hypothetical protein